MRQASLHDIVRYCDRLLRTSEVEDYDGAANNGQPDATASGPAQVDLAGALAAWLKSSGDVHQALSSILERRP